MNTRPTPQRERMSGVRRKAGGGAALLAALLGLAISAVPQEPKLGRIRDFKLPDYFDTPVAAGQTNRLKSLVLGDQAEPQPGGLVLVKTVRLANFFPDGQTNVIARAPECFVASERREVFSAGHLELETGNRRFFIEGDGWLCRLSNFHLTLTNRVRTVIRQEPAAPATR